LVAALDGPSRADPRSKKVNRKQPG
jgi:hypothetical protein